MLAPSSALLSENQPHLNARNQGAQKGGRTKQGSSGRVLGDVTNQVGGAKPQPEQARQRRALGDISNKKATAPSTGGKKADLPPVERMHSCEPAPPLEFDAAASRVGEVARAAAEHRAPIFSAAARSAPVPPLALEQLPPVASPWAAGASPAAMPAFRGVPPSPFALDASGASPTVEELDTTFAQMAPDLSQLQLDGASDESDMELEDD